jgi:hypothetical protein
MKIIMGQVVKTPDGLGRISDTLFGEYQVRFAPGVFAWYKRYQLQKINQCKHCAKNGSCLKQSSKIYTCNSEEVKWL